ncbi:MAG: DUF3761 domain-containing protein [Cytophagales bacterium]|nr:DUF3761 domain-containing protein [Bernardetiaceae bacterium]MDW8203929.1 DUF3761 domain-containing protein [Cytophagales bacterium]
MPVCSSLWCVLLFWIATNRLCAQNDTEVPPGFFGDQNKDNLPVRVQPAPNGGNKTNGENPPPDPSSEPDPETLRTYIRVGAICKDGTRSYSVNSGTCSGHGGVAFWLYGPPGTPPNTPLEKLVQIAPGKRRRGNYREIPLEPYYGMPYEQRAMIEPDQTYGWIYKSRHPAAIFVDILIIALAFLQVGWFIRKTIERYKSHQQP